MTKDRSRPWRAFPCPECGALIFTDAEPGESVRCSDCRAEVTVRRLGEIVEPLEVEHEAAEVR